LDYIIGFVEMPSVQPMGGRGFWHTKIEAFRSCGQILDHDATQTQGVPRMQAGRIWGIEDWTKATMTHLLTKNNAHLQFGDSFTQLNLLDFSGRGFRKVRNNKNPLWGSEPR